MVGGFGAPPSIECYISIQSFCVPDLRGNNFLTRLISDRVDGLQSCLVHDGVDGRLQLLLETRGSGDHVAAGGKPAGAVEIGYEAAGFADQQRAGSDVPRREA